ncbi:MAG TPA: hypothetical protein VF495_10235 [Phenylobacterium sp.]
MRLTPHVLMTALRRAGAFGAVAAVVALLAPIHYRDLHLPFPDTVAHAMLAYGLMMLSLGAFPRLRSSDIALAALGLSVASEVAQSLVGREMSLHDIFGDSFGIAAAYAPVALGRLRQLIRTHPHLTFSELRRIDPRYAKRPREALAPEPVAEA